jgi:hypothetical protein
VVGSWASSRKSEDTFSNRRIRCSRKYVFQTALFLGLTGFHRFAYGQLMRVA